MHFARGAELGNVVEEVPLHDGDVTPTLELLEPDGRGLHRKMPRDHVTEIDVAARTTSCSTARASAMCQARTGPAIFAVKTSSVIHHDTPGATPVEPWAQRSRLSSPR